jgi:hypothetical protein
MRLTLKILAALALAQWPTPRAFGACLKGKDHPGYIVGGGTARFRGRCRFRGGETPVESIEVNGIAATSEVESTAARQVLDSLSQGSEVSH